MDDGKIEDVGVTAASDPFLISQNITSFEFAAYSFALETKGSLLHLTSPAMQPDKTWMSTGESDGEAAFLWSIVSLMAVAKTNRGKHRLRGHLG